MIKMRYHPISPLLQAGIVEKIPTGLVVSHTGYCIVKARRIGKRLWITLDKEQEATLW